MVKKIVRLSAPVRYPPMTKQRKSRKSTGKTEARTAAYKSRSRSLSTRERSRAAFIAPNYATLASKSVWLTLDDGPHPTHTARILNVLARHDISVAFFVIGQNAARKMELVKKAFDAGHRIGNHTYSHRNLTKLTEAQIVEEIERTDDVIRNYTGSNKIFRPPYGAHNAVVDKVAARFGYRVVLWNVDTLDWHAGYRPDKWVQHGIDQIRARETSTVLVHDIHKSTADNIEFFIERIKSFGNVAFQEPIPVTAVASGE